MKLLTRHEEHVLLTILKLEDNAYLVTIKKYLEEYTSKTLSLGTLYVSLQRLGKMGYIRHHLGEATSKRGGKAIRYYSLTKTGLKALEQARQIQESIWNGFSQLAYKVQDSHE